MHRPARRLFATSARQWLLLLLAVVVLGQALTAYHQHTEHSSDACGLCLLGSNTTPPPTLFTWPQLQADKPASQYTPTEHTLLGRHDTLFRCRAPPLS